MVVYKEYTSVCICVQVFVRMKKQRIISRMKRLRVTPLSNLWDDHNAN